MTEKEILIEKYNLKLIATMDNACYLKSNDLSVIWTEAHDGNDNQFRLRAEFPETFERWNDCSFEEVFQLEEFENVLVKLDEFVHIKHTYLKKAH